MVRCLLLSLSSGKPHIQRRSVWAGTVFLLICYYMLLPINVDQISIIQDTYILCAVPVLAAAVFYFRRFRDGVEYKLLFAYWLWFWFSRALNGNPLLGRDFRVFFDLSLMLPFFALGAALSKAERTRLLDWLSAVIGGFYFIIGLIALSAFLHRSMYEIPLGGKIGIIREASYARINFFDNHPNTPGYWYLISLYLMIYQFFRCKKKLWRIPILLSSAVDLVVLAITYSRSARLCMAMTFALLAAMLLYQVFQNKSSFFRMVAVPAVAALVLVASYEGSSLCADVMATLSYDIVDIDTAPEAREQSAKQEDSVRTKDRLSLRPMLLSSGKSHSPEMTDLRGGLVQSDPRPKSGDLDELSSYRIQIWRAAFQAIATEPSVLWAGQMCDDVMTLTRNITERYNIPNMHNVLLQVLMTTGLPGLIFTVSFLVLIFYKGFLFLFSRKLPFDDRVLILPVVTVWPRIMLEAVLFTSTNIRTLFFFLMCGMVIGSTREYRQLKDTVYHE